MGLYAADPGRVAFQYRFDGMVHPVGIDAKAAQIVEFVGEMHHLNGEALVMQGLGQMDESQRDDHGQVLKMGILQVREGVAVLVIMIVRRN
ncbi:MAG: hypothetical protein KQI78_02250 [Deltaproteobacteria bacterium]|nr:hypothetical protein [Deltaproteobacteria bacterium]